MPSFLKIGGSSNISLNMSNGDYYELTGLDANGQVLQEINVQIISGDDPRTEGGILLPEPQSLNYRKVTYNIVNKDFAGSFTIVVNAPNTINGQEAVGIGGNFNFAYITTLVDQNTWALPQPYEN